MKKELLSIVIPTHGRTELFKETLLSLSKQTVRNFEIIITDDSSSERERDEIKKSIKLIENQAINVKYTYSIPNLKQARNTNQGLKCSEGQYLRILHSDDVLAPWCVELELKAFSENPECNFLTHSALKFSDDIKFTSNVKFGLFDLEQYWLRHNIFIHCVLPSCLVFTRSVYERIGGMREDYDFLCDWEFFFRMLLDGYVRGENTAMFYSPGLVGWRRHDCSISSTMSLTCFQEHERFISSIVPIYEEKSIITSKQLRAVVREATDYRYKRVMSDYNAYGNFKLPHIPMRYWLKKNGLLSIIGSKLFHKRRVR